jgi:hypothetical protein
MEFIDNYQSPLLIGLAVLALLQFALLLSTQGRMNRPAKLVRQLLTGPTGEDLEAMLNRCWMKASVLCTTATIWMSD